MMSIGFRNPIILASLICGFCLGPVQADDQANRASLPLNQPKPATQTNGLNLKHIPADFFAAMIVHPQRLKEYGVLLEATFRGFARGYRLEKLDLQQVERLTLLISSPSADLRTDPKIAFQIELVKGADVDKVISSVFAGAIPVVFREQTIYKPKNIGNRDLDFAITDDDLILVGPQDLVAAMLLPRDATTPLKKRLAATSLDKDIIVLVSLKLQHRWVLNLQADLKRTLEKQKSPLALSLVPFTALPDHVTFVKLTYDTSNKTLMRMEVATPSAASAKEVQRLLKAGAILGQLSYSSVQDFVSSNSNEQFAENVDKALQEITVTSRDNHVQVEFARPNGIEDIAKTLAPAIKRVQIGLFDSRYVNNLKQIGIAMHSYYHTFKSFPAAAWRLQKDLSPGLSWRVGLLPHMDKAELYKKFHLNEPWDSPHNKKLLNEMPDTYQSAGVEANGMTSILLVSGPKTAFSGKGRRVNVNIKQGPRIRDIIDGTSNTIMAIQVGSDKAVPWTKPADLVIDLAQPKKGLGQTSLFGFVALFFDGRVVKIPSSIDDELLRRMYQHQDRQVVQFPQR